MTSFADLALGLALAVMVPPAAPAPAAFSVDPPAAVSVPAVVVPAKADATEAIPVMGGASASRSIDPAWSERVVRTIAKRWNTTAPAVHLDWGALPLGGMPAVAAPYRLLGGTQGWFALSIDTGDGDVAVVRVRAGTTDSLSVATRDLARGERLRDGDFTVAAHTHWGAPRSNRSGLRPLAGWELRRAVVAGTVLDRPTVLPPSIVNPGDRLELWWSRGTVALALSGVALHGARLGEAVRVRIDGRPRPLTAIVDAPGRARIGSREAS